MEIDCGMPTETCDPRLEVRNLVDRPVAFQRKIDSGYAEETVALPGGDEGAAVTLGLRPPAITQAQKAKAAKPEHSLPLSCVRTARIKPTSSLPYHFDSLKLRSSSALERLSSVSPSSSAGCTWLCRLSSCNHCRARSSHKALFYCRRCHLKRLWASVPAA